MNNCKHCNKQIPESAAYCPWCGKRQMPEERKKRRRTKGTGGISKDQNTPNIPWRARVYFHGRSFLVGNFPTKKEAEDALYNFRQKEKPELQHLTVEQAYEAWQKGKFAGLEKRGIENYRTAWNYFNESIKKQKIGAIKTAGYQAIIDEAVSLGKSYSTVNKIKTLISQLCKFALSNDIIDRDYSEFLQMPKDNTEKRTPFTSDDLKIMWEHWQEDPCIAAILLMCYTGMRTDEFFSLEKKEQLPTMLHTAGSKTDKGKGSGNGRYCPTPYPISQIVEYFLNLPGEYLYSAPNGGKIDICNWRNRVYYKTIDKYGISHIVPYSTRHTFSTICLEKGVDKKAITDIMGHEKYSTTADHYTSPNMEWLSSEISKILQ